MTAEEKREVLLKTVPEFIKDCGIDYNEHINDIWPSEEFLTVNKRRNLQGAENAEVRMFDYVGVGRWLGVYKITCDKSRESRGIVDLNSTFYNMTGEQLEKSFEFFEQLLNMYGLSIHQEMNVQQRCELQSECFRKRRIK